MYRRPINRLEKTLHRMRRKHLLRLSFNGSRITFIAFEGIKVNQMPAYTIQKKAKQLLEDLGQRLSLAAFTDAAKLRFQMRQQSTVAQVSHKKAQTTAAGQGVVCNFNIINNMIAFCILCAIIFHTSSHPLGLLFGSVVLACTILIYHNLRPNGWVFL